MATEVLARQAAARAKRTGESLVEVLRAVLQTEAGRRLGRLRDGHHRDERADQWQPNLPQERAEGLFHKIKARDLRRVGVRDDGDSISFYPEDRRARTS